MIIGSNVAIPKNSCYKDRAYRQPRGGFMHIEELNYEDRDTQAQVIRYLAPHESYALFLLGNLKSDFPGAHLYAAVENGRWFGVAGYYESYLAVSLFTENATASRELIRRRAIQHPKICFLSGAEPSAGPACDALHSMGYQILADPQLTFMELIGQPPLQEAEKLCRPFREEDTTRIVELLRHLHNHPDANQTTDADLDNIRNTYLRHVLIHQGQVVSTASTNGMGIHAFQILGVATDESCRRRGFATAVCASVIREMSWRGATRCVLFTERDNIPAQRCYLRMGFRMTGYFYLARFQPPV